MWRQHDKEHVIWGKHGKEYDSFKVMWHQHGKSHALFTRSLTFASFEDVLSTSLQGYRNGVWININQAVFVKHYAPGGNSPKSYL